MQDLVGTWRGTVEVYTYAGSPRIKLLAGAQKMRRVLRDGVYVSEPTGETLRDTLLRIPRNVLYFTDQSIGGKPNDMVDPRTGRLAKKANLGIGNHRLDLHIQSERHCSLFLISDGENQDAPTPRNEPSPEPERNPYEGCTDCGVTHRFGPSCDLQGCKPDSFGWAHKSDCPRVNAPKLTPEITPNDLPKRPKDPGYIDRILKMCEVKLRSGHQKPIALIGPTQSGKTTIVVEIAKRLGATFFSNAFSLGLNEYDILGRLTPTNEAGVFEWQDSQFVQAFENGHSVYLADEFDAGDENALLVFNTALANGWMRIANRHDAPMANRTLGNLVFAAMNTYGTGSNLYVGRQQLDASTRQRFNPITVDYNPAWEWDIVYGGDNHANVKRDQRDELSELTKNVRKAINDGKLRQIWSTTNIHDAMAMMDVGFSLKDYIREQFMAWSDPERLVLKNAGVKVPDRV